MLSSNHHKSEDLFLCSSLKERQMSWGYNGTLFWPGPVWVAAVQDPVTPLSSSPQYLKRWSQTEVSQWPHTDLQLKCRDLSYVPELQWILCAS